MLHDSQETIAENARSHSATPRPSVPAAATPVPELDLDEFDFAGGVMTSEDEDEEAVSRRRLRKLEQRKNNY